MTKTKPVPVVVVDASPDDSCNEDDRALDLVAETSEAAAAAESEEDSEEDSEEESEEEGDADPQDEKEQEKAEKESEERRGQTAPWQISGATTASKHLAIRSGATNFVRNR